MKKWSIALMAVTTILASAVMAPLGVGAVSGKDAKVVSFSNGNPPGGWHNTVVSPSQEADTCVRYSYKGGAEIALPFNRIVPADIQGAKYLEFDIYTQDAALFSTEDTDVKIRITSSGDIYDESIDFNRDVLSTVKLTANDWTHVKLPMSKAVSGGGQKEIDLSAVDYFRFSIDKAPGSSSEKKELRLRNIIFTDGTKNVEMVGPDLSGLVFANANTGTAWRLTDNKLAAETGSFSTKLDDIGDFELTFKVNFLTVADGLHIDMDNGYGVHIRSNDNPNVTLYRPNGHPNGPWNANTEFKIAPETEHTVRVTVCGKVIEIFVDDLGPVVHDENATDLGDAGSLRFWNEGAKLTLDDVKIVALNEDGSHGDVLYENDFNEDYKLTAITEDKDEENSGNDNPPTGADMAMPAAAAVLGAAALIVLAAARKKSGKAD